MGDHGLYVWSAYGISFAVLVGLALRPRLMMRRFLKQHRISKHQGENRE